MLDPTGGNTVTHINGITDTIVNGTSLGVSGYLDIGLMDTMKDLKDADKDYLAQQREENE